MIVMMPHSGEKSCITLSEMGRDGGGGVGSFGAIRLFETKAGTCAPIRAEQFIEHITD